jgi:cyclopropane fatty-acyl-phospholipid synthase-like methyltransferase
LPEELSKFYPPAYYTDRNRPLWIRKYEKRYQYLKHLSGKTVLDIGCAKGDFLNHIQRYGYDVAGYEEICAENRYEFPIYYGSPQELINRGQKYDIITAWGVLEHLQQPSKYFDMAYQLLNHGGYFLLLVTNIESIASRYLYDEDIPRHTTFFSPRTIKKYASNYNFKIIKIYHKNDVYSLSYKNFLDFMMHLIRKQDYTQYDTLTYRLKQNASISRSFLVASKLLGRLARQYDKVRRRNAIITALLRK